MNDYKIIGDKKITVNGFTYSLKGLRENPMMLVMSLLTIDPSPLQLELLEKIGLEVNDADGKQMIPKIEVEEEKIFSDIPDEIDFTAFPELRKVKH